MTVQSTLTKKERFLGAIARKPIDRPPVWLMRQAGRYLPEYQKVKKEYSFHEMCRLPEIAAEVSLQPVRRYDMDAVIVFNDILIPLMPLGFDVEYAEGGPVVSPPVRHPDDLARVKAHSFDETPPVFHSIQTICQAVGEDTPVLGFAGAPFTLAAYMSEGVTSKNLRYIKTLLYQYPDTLRALMEQVTQVVIEYLRIQIRAGASAVQIFDTWAGTLSKEDYRAFALPYQQEIVSTIQAEGTPVILYVKSSGHLLHELKASGAQVLSIDWLTGLDEVDALLGLETVLQGNLDPTALYAEPAIVAQKTLSLLESLQRTTGHVMNLGHGILPETPTDSVAAFVETVKAYGYPNA